MDADKVKVKQQALKKQKVNFSIPQLDLKRPFSDLDHLLNNNALQQGWPDLAISPPLLLKKKENSKKIENKCV